MEISGKDLREVEFRDRLRGYDTDEVDEFLERVAVAIDDLRREMQSLVVRAEQAERTGREARPSDDPDVPDGDSIRRTLVLAQRTADLAIKEANDEAGRLLAEARAQASGVVGEAEQHARRLREEAEDELDARVTRLNDEQARLEGEVQSLARLINAERERLSEGLVATLRVVEGHLALSEDAVTAAARPEATPRALARQPSAETAPTSSPGPAQPHSPAAKPVAIPDFEAEIAEDAASARSDPPATPEGASDRDEELWARWTQGVDLGVVPDPDAPAERDDPFGFDRKGFTV